MNIKGGFKIIKEKAANRLLSYSKKRMRGNETLEEGAGLSEEIFYMYIQEGGDEINCV